MRRSQASLPYYVRVAHTYHTSPRDAHRTKTYVHPSYLIILKDVHGSGQNLAGQVWSRRGTVTGPNPREYESLLTRPDPTLEIQKRFRNNPDPTRGLEKWPAKSLVVIAQQPGLVREADTRSLYNVIEPSKCHVNLL